MQPRTNGPRGQMNRPSNTYGRSGPQVYAYNPPPLVNRQNGTYRPPAAKGGSSLKSLLGFGRPKAAPAMRPGNAAPAMHPFNAPTVNRTKTKDRRTTGAVLSAVCVMSFFMGWVSMGPVSMSGFALFIGSLDSPLTSATPFYAAIAAVLGMVSVIIYKKSVDSRMLKMGVGAAISAVGVLSFMGVGNGFGFFFDKPGIGILVCCICGIGLMILPMLESPGAKPGY